MNEKTLAQLFAEHVGKVSDRWSSYFDEYDRLLGPYRSRSVRLLEIGVQNGGSLEVWSAYFPNAQTLVGCDIDDRCAHLRYDDPRIAIVVGDASSETTLAASLVHAQAFDVIIDDGSHRSSDIVKSFARYFPCLADEGIFVVEDLHCSYWRDFEGGLFDPLSSIAFFKRLADVVNHEHWGIEASRAEVLNGFLSRYHFRIDVESLKHVHSVEFANSLCAIRKAAPARNRLGGRAIVGTVETVAAGHVGPEGPRSLPMRIPDETANAWTARRMPPDEELPLRIEELAERDGQLASLTRVLAECDGEITALSRVVNERDEQLAALSRVVTERDEQLAALSRIVAERDEQLAALSRAVTERDEQLAALNRVVAERDRQQAALNDAVAGLDRQMAALSQAATERDEQIAGLSHVVGRRDKQIAALEQAVAAFDTQNADLSQAATERNAQIAGLSHAVGERDGQIAALNHLVAELNALLTAVTNSRSWRLTKPLRVAVRETRRARRVVGALAARATINKAMRLARREGLTGITRGFRTIAASGQGTPAPVAAPLDRSHGAERTDGGDTITLDALTDMRAWIDGSADRPLISVVMPTYNPRPEWLTAAIESVRTQVYPHWELCVADDASTDKALRPILEHYARIDQRVRVVFREQNGHISAASNSALAMASGQYVALLDHDDELSADALYWVAREMSADPGVDLIYSDEDRIRSDGGRTDVFFKPDWSPELLYNCMYTGHLSVYRRALLDRLGGFRSEFDFSQDYDLALRATEVAQTIRHIPRVLYHWRQADGSAARGEKPHARVSNLAALRAAVERRGLAAEVVELPTANRVKFIGWRPSVSVVIPTDSEANITACLDAIADQTLYPSWDIIVVTNSTLADRLARRYSRLPIAFCRYDAAFNFSDKCNQGAEEATGEIVLFLNDDVRPLAAGWLEDVVELLAVPDVGAVAPKLVYEDRRIQHAGLVTGVRGLVGTAFHCLPEDTTQHFNFAQSVRDVSALSAACLAVRRRDFLEIGGFDAVHAPIMHSDVDLSFKLREKGLRCVYTPHATLVHMGHRSLEEFERTVPKDRQDKAEIFLLKRWGSYITRDPYFPDNMRGLLYRDSPDPINMDGHNRPDRVDHRPDVLVVTHDLSASGAPKVVYYAVKHLLASGAFPVVASPADGPMRSVFSSLGIPVIIDPLFLSRHDSVRQLARNFDCVLASTVVNWPIVYQLLDEAVPVMWYLHECELIRELAQRDSLVAAALRQSRHVFAGSERSASFCRPFNRGVTILNYGVADIYRPGRQPVSSGAAVVFSVFGSIEPRKGQDVLLQAIRLLGDRAAGKAAFNIVGRTLDQGWELTLRGLAEGLEHVTFHGAMDYDQYLGLMTESDVIVCPSRDDALPLVTLDALSLGKALICSDTTGTADFMTSGRDGVVVPSAHPGALAEAMSRLIDDPTLIMPMGAEGRHTYLRHFSEERFAGRIVDAVRALSRQVS